MGAKRPKNLVYYIFQKLRNKHYLRKISKNEKLNFAGKIVVNSFCSLIHVISDVRTKWHDINIDAHDINIDAHDINIDALIKSTKKQDKKKYLRICKQSISIIFVQGYTCKLENQHAG